MAKLRLFFRKEGRAVYISHLDLLRTFQRVFLRQGLVLKHSQGFHPHPILSIGPVAYTPQPRPALIRG